MFNWVWIAEVTPLTYPNWVDVTEDTAIFPEPFEIKARLTVRLEVLTVEIAPDRSDKPTLNVGFIGDKSIRIITDTGNAASLYFQAKSGIYYSVLS